MSNPKPIGELTKSLNPHVAIWTERLGDQPAWNWFSMIVDETLATSVNAMRGDKRSARRGLINIASMAIALIWRMEREDKQNNRSVPGLKTGC